MDHDSQRDGDRPKRSSKSRKSKKRSDDDGKAFRRVKSTRPVGNDRVQRRRHHRHHRRQRAHGEDSIDRSKNEGQPVVVVDGTATLSPGTRPGRSTSVFANNHKQSLKQQRNFSSRELVPTDAAKKEAKRDRKQKKKKKKKRTQKPLSPDEEDSHPTKASTRSREERVARFGSRSVVVSREKRSSGRRARRRDDGLHRSSKPSSPSPLAGGCDVSDSTPSDASSHLPPAPIRDYSGADVGASSSAAAGAPLVKKTRKKSKKSKRKGKSTDAGASNASVPAPNTAAASGLRDIGGGSMAAEARVVVGASSAGEGNDDDIVEVVPRKVVGSGDDGDGDDVSVAVETSPAPSSTTTKASPPVPSSTVEKKEDLRGRFKRFASSKSVGVVRKAKISAKSEDGDEDISNPSAAAAGLSSSANDRDSSAATAVGGGTVDKASMRRGGLLDKSHSKHHSRSKSKARLFGSKSGSNRSGAKDKGPHPFAAAAAAAASGGNGSAGAAVVVTATTTSTGEELGGVADSASMRADATTTAAAHADSLLADVKRQRVALIGRVAELEEREQRLNEMEERLDAQDAALRKLATRLDAQDKDASARQEALALREASAMEEAGRLDALGSALDAKQIALDERDALVSKHEESLAIRTRNAEAREAALCERESAVAELARETADLQARLTASAVNAKVKEAEAAIARGKQMVVRASRLADVATLDALESLPHLGILRMQKMVRHYMLLKKWKALIEHLRHGDEKRVRRLRNRTRAIQEAVDTEKTYVEAMMECAMLYLAKLEKGGMVTPEDCHVIFGNIRAILAVNSKFLSDLEASWKQFPQSQRISEQFIQFVPLLDVYKPYVQGFDIATKRLAALKASNPAFKEFVEGLHGTKNLPLSGYLIQPVQRLARYDILLKEIIKNTENEHVDYLNLVEARRLICNKVLWVDEQKDNMDHYREAQEIRKKQHLVMNLHEVVLVNNGVYPMNLMERESVPMHHLLIVEVLDGKDLPAMDSGKTSDPFLILTLGAQQAKTKPIKKTLNPNWQQKYVFEVHNENQSLLIDCWDWNRMSKSEYMCSAEMSIMRISEELSGKPADQYPMYRYSLKSCTTDPSALPSAGTLGLSFQLVTVASAPSPRLSPSLKARRSGNLATKAPRAPQQQAVKVRHSEALIRGARTSSAEAIVLPTLSFQGRAPQTPEEMAEFKAYQIKKYQMQQSQMARAASEDEPVLSKDALGLEGAFPKSMDRRSVSVAGIRDREKDKSRKSRGSEHSKKGSRKSRVGRRRPSAVGSERLPVVRGAHLLPPQPHASSSDNLLRTESDESSLRTSSSTSTSSTASSSSKKKRHSREKEKHKNGVAGEIPAPLTRNRSRSTVIKRNARVQRKHSDKLSRRGVDVAGKSPLPALPDRDVEYNSAARRLRREKRRKAREQRKSRHKRRRRAARRRKRRAARKKRRGPLEESNARFEESRTVRSADEPLPMPGGGTSSCPTSEISEAETTTGSCSSSSSSNSSSSSSSSSSESSECWDAAIGSAALVVADGESSTASVIRPPPSTPGGAGGDVVGLGNGTHSLPRIVTPQDVRPATPKPSPTGAAKEEPLRLPNSPAALSLEGSFPKSLERRSVSVAVIRGKGSDGVIRRPPPPSYPPPGSAVPVAVASRAIPKPPPSFLAKANVAWAMYDFVAQQEGDLWFSAGEKVMVTRREGAWWRGFCVNQAGERRFGVFPSNYIQVAVDEHGRDRVVEIRVFAKHRSGATK